MTETLETVEIETGPNPVWSVVWLHGLGADGHDFEPVVAEFDLPEGVRFVFPHAPVRPVTINGGYPMRAWYDIVSLDRGGPEDEAGICASADQVRRLMEIEADRGTPASRLIIAGFSQGGAMALHAGLRHPEPVAGIIALSCYLLLPSAFAEEKAAPEGVPIFMAHGTDDPTVPESYGALARDRLRSEGYGVEWHTYPMGHSVCVEEITELSDWLGARLRSSN